jgi:glucose-6-phosphate 1-dehydrogenase
VREQLLLLVGSATADWDDDRWRRRVAESFAFAGAIPARPPV